MLESSKMNFSALPTDAAAVSMRFEFVTRKFGDEWQNGDTRALPIVVRKEWVHPRNDNVQPVYKTVRISEHRWPLHKSTFMCSNAASQSPSAYPNDGWPARPLPMTRAELVDNNLLTPWQCYPDPKGEVYLSLDDKAWGAHEFNLEFGSDAPNDGLPDDYLEFWNSWNSWNSETQEGAAQ